MLMSPIFGKFLVLGVLTGAWMLMHRRVQMLEAGKAYHVAANERDRRKARFYFLSVWVGLLAAFLSFVSSEGVAAVPFESNILRQWVAGLLHGVGLWGFSLVALVWSQVGHRVSQPNSDGRALLPTRQPLNSGP